MSKNDDLFNAVAKGEIGMDSPIRVLSGPAGSGGFRSGNWKVSIGGIEFDVYSSVSHKLELDKQNESVIASVRRSISRALAGDTQRYTSQATRL